MYRFAQHAALPHTLVHEFATHGAVLFGAFLVVGWWLARSSSPRAVAASIWTIIATLLAVRLAQLLQHVHTGGASTYWSLFGVPSFHAALAGAVAAGLWFYCRPLAIVATVAALLLALSRIAVHSHITHDVVVGLALGALITTCGWWPLARPLTAAVVRIGRTRLRPLVSPRAVARIQTSPAPLGK